MRKQAQRLFAVMAVALAFGLLALPVRAQSPVTAGVDRDHVTTDDQVTLNVVVDAAMGQPDQPVLPALDGLEVLNATSGMRMSTANGASTVQAIYQYTLQPLRAGDLVIAPISVGVGGQTYQTDPIALAVAQGTGQPRPAGSPGLSGGLGNLSGLLGSGMDPFALLDQLSNGSGAAPLATASTLPPIEAPKGLTGQDYFVEATVDNTNPYQGEQVIYTVRLYQAVNPAGQIGYSAPSFTGFWSKQLPDQKRYRTQAAGRDYLVVELRTLLFATMAGTPKLDPVRFSVPGTVFSQGAELSSEPVTLTVKPLPAGAPASFGGAVGQFQIDAAVDKNAVKVGDTVYQQVRISGLGNLEMLPDPQWPESDAWRAFDSKAQTTTAMQGDKLGGTRTYNRVMMPTAPGSAALPAIEFTYFDPARGAYHTVSTSPLAVTVAPDAAAAQTDQSSTATAAGGANLAPSSAGPGAAANINVALAHPAIRQLQATPAAWQHGANPLPGQNWYWLLWSLPLFVLGTQYAVERRQAARQANPALLRSRHARRQAHKALKVARQHPDQTAQAADEILTGYLAGKLNRPVAGLTNQELSALLSARGIDPELAARTQNCLLASQAERYTPEAVNSASKRRMGLLVEIESIVEELEQQWDGGKS